MSLKDDNFVRNEKPCSINLNFKAFNRKLFPGALEWLSVVKNKCYIKFETDCYSLFKLYYKAPDDFCLIENRAIYRYVLIA